MTGGLEQDPKETLPGPGGPFGNPTFPTDIKEEGADLAQGAGGIAMGIGAFFATIGVGIAAAPEPTPASEFAGAAILGLGGGFFVVGTFYATTGVVLDAADPPRYDYRAPVYSDPLAPPRLDVLGIKALRARPHSSFKPLFEKSYAAMVSAVNFLAAQEYYIGAALMKDEVWMRAHRVTYVQTWNAMRSYLIESTAVLDPVCSAALDALRFARLSPERLGERYDQVRGILEPRIRADFNAVLDGVEESCIDLKLLRDKMPDPVMPKSFGMFPDNLTSVAKALRTTVESLPVFS